MVFSFDKELFANVEPFINSTFQNIHNKIQTQIQTTYSNNPIKLSNVVTTYSPQNTPIQSYNKNIQQQLFTPTPNVKHPVSFRPQSSKNLEKQRVIIPKYQSNDIFGDLFSKISNYIQKNDTTFFIFIFFLTLIGVLLIVSLFLPLIRRFIRKRKELYGTSVAY